MIPKPILIVVDKNGERRAFKELSEEEQDEFREKLTRKVIELFSKYIDRSENNISDPLD